MTLLPRPVVRAVLRARDAMMRAADAIVPPEAALLDEVAGVGRTAALHLVAKHHVANHLAAGPKTKDQLARLTGLRPELLERVMSLLVARGIFRVDKAGCYDNTRTSSALVSENERSMRAMAEYFGAPFNLVAWANLEGGLRSGAPVFDATHGADIWEFFAKHEEHGRLFAAAMSELTNIDAPMIAAGYPFERFERICDVAGGRGTLLAAILARHARPRGVLVEADYVLDEAKQYLAERGLAERVDRVVGNFFEALPRGHDAYLLKDILHDWDDTRAVAILKNVRAAMKPSAKVLVCELPIDHLRPEYPAPISDLQMLVVTGGGKQRSEAQFRALFEAANLSLSDVRHLAVPMSIFEASPR